MKSVRYETVSLDDLGARLGFEPSYVMPWDESEQSDDSPSQEWSDEQRVLAQALLAAGFTAQHVRTGFLGATLADLVGTSTTQPVPFNKSEESTMEITEQSPATPDQQVNTAAYDSGVPDSESNTLAEQIDAVGIETVTSAIVNASTGASVADDVAAERVFDPDAYGFVPVLDVFTDDEIESVLVPLCQKTVGGDPNPLYVSQQWLDSDVGLERLYLSRVPSTEPGDRLGQPVVIYTQQHEDDESGFVSNLPVAFTKVLTIKAGRDFIRQFRPAPSVEDQERTAAARTSAADKIRSLQHTQF